MNASEKNIPEEQGLAHRVSNLKRFEMTRFGSTVRGTLNSDTLYVALHRNDEGDQIEYSTKKSTLLEEGATVYDSVTCVVDADPMTDGIVFLECVLLRFSELQGIPYNVCPFCTHCKWYSNELMRVIRHLRDDQEWRIHLFQEPYRPLKELAWRERERATTFKLNFLLLLPLLLFLPYLLLFLLLFVYVLSALLS